MVKKEDIIKGPIEELDEFNSLLSELIEIEKKFKKLGYELNVQRPLFKKID